ncbi:MAG: M28 family peptidase [Planctomycetes bacterium]|nr:M28 family peptidase [Planctomycetota bacterium]
MLPRPGSAANTSARRRLGPLFALALLAGCSSDARDAGTKPDARALGPNAWKHLQTLVALGPRPPGSPALEKTRVYLETELARAGFHPEREPFEARTPVGVFQLANVRADLPARTASAPRVILATHFDTKLGLDGFVGANDGGSGTALLLELARVLADGGPRDVALRFLFLDGEEATRAQWEGEDNCYGSRHHARELVRSGAAANVRAFVLLDMIGDKDLALVDETWSDRRLKELFRAAAKRAGRPQIFAGRSEAIEDDHGPFLDADIPSIDLIDFSYGPNHAWWHTREDTLDKCSEQSLADVGLLVLAALPALEHEFAR